MASHIYIYLLCALTSLVNSARNPSEGYFRRNKLYYEKIHGKGYGTKWIYFPDGDGDLHYLDMTSPVVGLGPVQKNMADEIEYRLYIWNNTKKYILLDDSANAFEKFYQNLTTQIISSNLPLKIITHGWRSSADKDAVLSIKNAYLESNNFIVLTVDWSITADSLLYPWVANETKSVGAKLASFLNKLCSRYNITGKPIHLIGHSLGAHVMGIAASKTTSVHRVTGLDPARPFFEYPPQDDSGKLDSSDAEFVDVIHTCGGLLGFQDPIGTADFYPNNGIAPQPGCDNIFKFFEACSHSRSYYYFSESIRYPKSFPAYQCQSWTEFLENRCGQYGYMGENVSRNTTGKYYLKTNAFEPFGRQTKV